MRQDHKPVRESLHQDRIGSVADHLEMASTHRELHHVACILLLRGLWSFWCIGGQPAHVRGPVGQFPVLCGHERDAQGTFREDSDRKCRIRKKQSRNRVD